MATQYLLNAKVRSHNLKPGSAHRIDSMYAWKIKGARRPERFCSHAVHGDIFHEHVLTFELVVGVTHAYWYLYEINLYGY